MPGQCHARRGRPPGIDLGSDLGGRGRAHRYRVPALSRRARLVTGHPSGMATPTNWDRVRDAWARLAEVDHLNGRQILVRDSSPLCPPGWIGVLSLDGTLTVTVPRVELVEDIGSALAGLPPSEATAVEVVRRGIEGVADVLGPAQLFYPVGDPTQWPPDGRVTAADPGALHDLLASAGSGEAAESGLGEIEGSASTIRLAETVVAAAGWQPWPNGVAHLCVLTRPGHRKRGLGAAVSQDAIRRAAGDGWIPQWRARPLASQRLARHLGLVQVGAQLSFRLADR